MVLCALVQVSRNVGGPWLVPVRRKDRAVPFGPPAHWLHRVHHIMEVVVPRLVPVHQLLCAPHLLLLHQLFLQDDCLVVLLVLLLPRPPSLNHAPQNHQHHVDQQKPQKALDDAQWREWIVSLFIVPILEGCIEGVLLGPATRVLRVVVMVVLLILPLSLLLVRTTTVWVLLRLSHALVVLLFFLLRLTHPLFETPLLLLLLALAVARARLSILPRSLMLGLLVVPTRVEVKLVSVLVTEGRALEVAFLG